MSEQLTVESNLPDIKTIVEKEAWLALKEYFEGGENMGEAKIAILVVGTLAKEAQNTNQTRQLDIIEKKLPKELTQ
jgi:hypothetical protein